MEFETLKGELRKTGRGGIEDLIDYLERSDFLKMPASAKYHSNFEGGLLHHTYKVWENLSVLSKAYENYCKLTEANIIIAAVCHDLSKIGKYKVDFRNKKDDNGVWQKVPFFNYAEPTEIALSHSYLSIHIAEKFIKLEDIEKIMIANHMGMIGVGFSEQQEVADAFKRYPESLLLHTADMMASYVFEEVRP